MILKLLQYNFRKCVNSVTLFKKNVKLFQLIMLNLVFSNFINGYKLKKN